MSVDLAVELRPHQSIPIPRGTKAISVTNRSDQNGALQITIGDLERRVEVPAHTQGRSVDLGAGGEQATVTNVGEVPIGVAY